MAKLVVRLLGGFHVELDGRAIHRFESDKCRALLAYLVVEAGRPHRRETLSGLLWPDRPDAVARANLRQALSALRRALTVSAAPKDAAANFLFVTPTDVQFNTASDTTLDVADLQAFARPGEGHARPRHEQVLPETLCADFLAGFALPDSETFQAWVLDKQEHYHRLTLDILDEQAATFEEIGDYGKAVAAARLQLRMEPWLEEAHRRCMRDLALGGRRDEALHQYELCCRSLEAELAAEPSESTQALFADIQAGRLVAPGQGLGRRPPSTAPGEARLRSGCLGEQAGAGPARLAGRLGEQAGAGPARLAGREDELGALTRHLYGALAGETGVIFVSGDPGSGKTALLEAFAASALAEHPDLLVAGARCSPGGTRDPFAPLRRLAEMLFGDLYRDVAWRPAGREEVDRLGAATGLALACLEEHGPDLAGTLIPTASIARRAGLSSDGTRGGPTSQETLSQTALFDQFLCTLAAIARQRPLVLLLDDLHWVDDATAAFLLHLGREVADSRLLVLGAYRSEPLGMSRRDPTTGETVRHPLASAIDELRRLKGEIVVDLDRADGRAFVEAYVDGEPNRLGSRFRDALYAQTGGHALFTVELLRNLQERRELLKDEAGRWVAHESLDWGRLPTRVEAAIADRIERLPDQEREILTAASVQGDDFSGELVAEVTGRPVREVVTCLSRSLARMHHLVRSTVVSRADSRQGSLYRFTHHLFQKYLYDQLDAAERGQLHVAIAAGLDRQAGDDPVERERLSTQLAWHYEAGGMPVQAARALLDAGRLAMRVSAFREALDLFDHGLALLDQVDAARSVKSGSAERATAEAVQIRRLLQIARLVPQRSLSGSGASELEGALAQVMGAGAGDLQDRARLATLASEADHAVARGQFEEVLALAQQMLDLSTRCGDDAFEALAHFWFGFVYHFLGEPRKADGYFEWILARHTPGRWAELRAVIGYDLLPHTLIMSAINGLSLGRLDAALVRSARAVTAAQDLGDQYGLAFVTAIGSTALFLLRGDLQGLQERAGLCCRHCEKHGFAWWQFYAAAFLGWLIVVRGEPDEGIAAMHRAMAAWQATGMLLGPDSLAILLADATLEVVRRRPEADDPLAGARLAGLLGEALAGIDAALAPDSLAGHCYQAELHRMRGELLLARDGLAAAGEALDCFERAMARGREKGALTWELRAAMSIVRLRESQGADHGSELAEARQGLAAVVARFTEGFGFPDLQEAAALLWGASA